MATKSTDDQKIDAEDDAGNITATNASGSEHASTQETSEIFMPPCNLKCTNEKYIEYRETARMMMHLIDSRDREKVSKWIDRLNAMDDDAGQLERLHYARYLVSTLAGSSGLMEPFTSAPPETVKPLRIIVPPVVFADLLDDQPEDCPRRPAADLRKPSVKSHALQDDRKFFEEQMFPPDGVLCYAAAFSSP